MEDLLTVHDSGCFGRRKRFVDVTAGVGSLNDTGSGKHRLCIMKQGETLWKIAQHYQTTVAAVAAANKIVNVDLIKVGEKLVIPGAKTGQTKPSRGGRTFSASELDLLARLVQAEAGGEPYQGQVAVAATILNRLDSPRFPTQLPRLFIRL